LNPSFNLQSPGISASSSSLLVEAGPMGLSFIITGENSLDALLIDSVLPGVIAAEIADVMKSIFEKEEYLKCDFKKTDVVWVFPESTLVPGEFYRDELSKALLDLQYGDATGNIQFHDFMYRHNLHNIYRIPTDVMNIVPGRFKHAHQTHQHSLVADLPLNTGKHLLAIFYHHQLTIVLRDEGKLLLVKSLEYPDPEAAAFHLLNACSAFELPVDEVTLELCGMIDADSNLYAALYKYFLKVQWYSIPGETNCTEAIKAYPTHFFSHLYALTQCV